MGIRKIVIQKSVEWSVSNDRSVTSGGHHCIIRVKSCAIRLMYESICFLPLVLFLEKALYRIFHVERTSRPSSTRCSMATETGLDRKPSSFRRRSVDMCIPVACSQTFVLPARLSGLSLTADCASGEKRLSCSLASAPWLYASTMSYVGDVRNDSIYLQLKSA